MHASSSRAGSISTRSAAGNPRSRHHRIARLDLSGADLLRRGSATERRRYALVERCYLHRAVVRRPPRRSSCAVQRFRPARGIGPAPRRALGLSSLERVEVMRRCHASHDPRSFLRYARTVASGAAGRASSGPTRPRPAAARSDSAAAAPAKLSTTVVVFHVESPPAVHVDTQREPADLDSPDRASLRLGHRRRARAPRGPPGTGRLRRQPPEPPRRTDGAVVAAAALALPRGHRHGQGVLHGPFLPRAIRGKGGHEHKYYLRAFFNDSPCRGGRHARPATLAPVRRGLLAGHFRREATQMPANPFRGGTGYRGGSTPCRSGGSAPKRSSAPKWQTVRPYPLAHLAEAGGNTRPGEEGEAVRIGTGWVGACVLSKDDLSTS